MKASMKNKKEDFKLNEIVYFTIFTEPKLEVFIPSLRIIEKNESLNRGNSYVVEINRTDPGN